MFLLLLEYNILSGSHWSRSGSGIIIVAAGINITLRRFFATDISTAQAPDVQLAIVLARMPCPVTMRILALLTLLGLLAGCSAMLIGEGTTSAPAIGSSDRSSQQIAADEAVETAVRSEFSSDAALKSANVAIAVNEAVVTLSGTLGSFELRDHAIGIAEAVKGVAGVNNQLQVNTRQ